MQESRIDSLFPAIYPVACHTDNVGPGTTFVAMDGMRESGVTYIQPAIEKGASGVVVSNKVSLSADLEDFLKEKKIVVHRVANPRKELALLSAQAWGHPAGKLKIIGVTGTKGKTTTSFLLYNLLMKAGKSVGLITSAQNRINQAVYPVMLTTPHPDYLHMFLAQCVERGVEWVVLESAAQAFSLHRVDGIMFDAGVFTNFAPTHAEFYQTPQEYFDAKAAIITHLKPGAALYYNALDNSIARFISNNQPFNTHAFACVTEGMVPKNVNTVVSLETWTRGLRGRITVDGESESFAMPHFMGSFNGANGAAAVSVAMTTVGIPLTQAVKLLSTIEGVPGRLNCYELANGALGVIDKAHTPESYDAVLSLLRGLTEHLIVIFGAGGDRQASVRPVLARIVCQHADYLFITDDNPRYEEPEGIINEVYAGVPEDSKAKAQICRDRAQAMEKAYALSRNGSIIALLGKGSDEYELVKGVKIPFSERTILQHLGH